MTGILQRVQKLPLSLILMPNCDFREQVRVAGPWEIALIFMDLTSFTTQNDGNFAVSSKMTLKFYFDAS